MGSVRIQRAVGQVLSPLWVTALSALVRFGFGWRVEGTGEVRSLYARLRREPDVPLMICANHLTMLDSFLIGAALGSPLFFLRDYGAVPWNTPEREHFAAHAWQRALVYVMKCIPVTRGGDREEMARTIGRVREVLRSGDPVLMFPEGGRSRTGRVDATNAAWGVGRLVREVPGCRVLCVYLRGEGQETWSERPHRAERFHVTACTFEPKTDHSGLRGSVEVVRQILSRLGEMEEAHFGGR